MFFFAELFIGVQRYHFFRGESSIIITALKLTVVLQANKDLTSYIKIVFMKSKYLSEMIN
jgi:hypothetical protein